jgi:hypothetical protein
MWARRSSVFSSLVFGEKNQGEGQSREEMEQSIFCIGFSDVFFLQVFAEIDLSLIGKFHGFIFSERTSF